MPIYEYQCKTCQSKFEVLQSINADNSELVVSRLWCGKADEGFFQFCIARKWESCSL